jgi:glycosyltransferase involved in cell wall biosynthesis
MKVAFMGMPILGGNYTHYQYLKSGLHEIEFVLISVGENKATPLYDDTYIQIGPGLDRKNNKRELALLLLDFVNSNGFDILIPMNSPITISIIPFLDRNINVIQIVNSDTPRVYKYVTAHLVYISSIICISQRQVSVLANKAAHIKKKLSLIPHGVNIDSTDIKKNHSDILVIGYLGRLHQGHKGIFNIPLILKELTFAFELQIIGDGPDQEELIKQLDGQGINYICYGYKDQDEIPVIIAKWDLMLFPSIIEGFGLTLIESMRFGVVPLANKINGITDYIIQDGISGFIIDNNEISRYVKYISLLNNDRKLLNKMKFEAKARVTERFNLKDILQQYRQAFQNGTTFNKPQAKAFKDWRPYVEYKPSLYTRILNRLK